ncbi:MAG: hypothetical protein HC884_17010, partial [Chloroflexaceae bacterium]|nr:hypothetical protein [Chloroflexaceae bacterium]
MTTTTTTTTATTEPDDQDDQDYQDNQADQADSDEEDQPLNLDDIALLFGAPPAGEDVLFATYIEYVANAGLLPYKAMIHDRGLKAGEIALHSRPERYPGTPA